MKRDGFEIKVQEWKGSRWLTVGIEHTIEGAKKTARAIVANINRPDVRAKIINLETGRVTGLF